jgi:hypothetical protein
MSDVEEEFEGSMERVKRDDRKRKIADVNASFKLSGKKKFMKMEFIKSF